MTKFVYDHASVRKIKSAASPTIYPNQYYTDFGGGAGNQFKHIFLGETRILTKKARIAPDRQHWYYHPDHLGSTDMVTNENGQLTEHTHYFPFGEVWLDERPASLPTPYLFTAKEFDPETGLYDFGARYLDPRFSKWMSTDPADRIGAGAPIIALNRYQYGLHNPARYFDPNGAFEFDANDAQEAREAAADRTRQSVQPVEGRQEGAITAYFVWMGQRLKEDLTHIFWHPESIVSTGKLGPGTLIGAIKPRFTPRGPASIPEVTVVEQSAARSGSGTRLRDPGGRFVTDPANPPSPYVFTDAQRRAAWRSLANDKNSPLTEAERAEIKARGWRGPQRVNPVTNEIETMELSHEPIPLREGGTKVVPRWPADHAAVDPHRQLKKER